MTLLASGADAQSLIPLSQEEDDQDILLYEKETMERTKLPDINQKVNDMSVTSDYGGDNQVTDYT